MSLQIEEDFSKKRRKRNNKNDPILALKTGPILLRNRLGPVFNASLDQFLTLGFFLVFFSLFCFFLGGGAETPIFIVCFSKKQNLEKHKKEEKTLFVSRLVLTALVPASFFSAFFIFVFFAISIF